MHSVPLKKQSISPCCMQVRVFLTGLYCSITKYNAVISRILDIFEEIFKRKDLPLMGDAPCDTDYLFGLMQKGIKVLCAVKITSNRCIHSY